MTGMPSAFRRAALPLASYYAITLGLPAANGAARANAFTKHALIVLAVPAIIIVLACAARWSFSSLWRFVWDRVAEDG